MCEAQLCENLSVENAAARLVLSDQAEAGDLKDACLGFIKARGSEVMQSEGWASVAAYNAGSLAVEVCQAMAGLARGQKRSAEEAGLSSAKQAEIDAVNGMNMAQLKNP